MTSNGDGHGVMKIIIYIRIAINSKIIVKIFIIIKTTVTMSYD